MKTNMLCNCILIITYFYGGRMTGIIKKTFWVILIVCDVLFTACVYSQSVNSELSDKLLRLHVIANSNSDYDISVKYAVRDKINEWIAEETFSDREEVIDRLFLIENRVNDYLSESNAEYGCKIMYTVSKFPQKQYDNIVMPSGSYECIKAVLGEGRGENWWCIAYPPLCFTESVTGALSGEGENKLKNELSEDTYDLIHSEKTKYKIKFFAVDLINKYLN